MPRRDGRSRTIFTIVMGALSLAAAVVAAPAGAIEVRGGRHVLVEAGEVVADDLYATGETVTVDGRVEGDLVAAGREVRLRGEVTGDLIAAGQGVVVDGRVGDDARIAGMALQIAAGGVVGDDLVAAGMSLESLPASVVRGTLLFTGIQALLAGTVEEGLTGSMEGLELRGTLGGDGQVEVGAAADPPAFLALIPAPVALPSVPGGLTIAEGARIGGRLEYTSPDEARGGGAGAAALVHSRPAVDEEEAVVERKSPWPGRLLRWAGLLLLGLLLAWLIPGWLDRRCGEIASRPVLVGAVGLVGLAALPVAIVAVAAVVLTLALLLGALHLGGLTALAVVLGLVGTGLPLLAFWLTLGYLAPLLVGLWVGRELLRRLAAERAGALVLPLVAGLVLIALLRWVPYLGVAVAVVVLALGWGALLRWLWAAVRSGPRAVEPAA